MPATQPTSPPPLPPARRIAKRLRHSLVLLAWVVAITAAITAAHAADKSLDLRFAALSMGDSPDDVRRVMQADPKETRRTSVAGIEKTVLVFEIEGQRYGITLIAGRLVAKTVESRPSGWKLF